MWKVEKHIAECQNEVKSNIFHEAFSLIHDTAFHHPHEHATIKYKDEHDDFAHHNFTLTEQEILKFFENNGHNIKAHGGHHLDIAHTDFPVNPHPHLNSHSHHHSIDEQLHDHDHPPIESFDEFEHSHLRHQHHTLTEHAQHQPHAPHASNAPHTPKSIVHYPQANFYDWQEPYSENIHKKTDAIQQTGKSDEQEQRSSNTMPANRNPYTYFDIKTGTTAKNQEQQVSRRSDVHATDVHSDSNHHSDIHPTTASFKDKRIAGVSTHVYDKCNVFISNNIKRNFATHSND